MEQEVKLSIKKTMIFDALMFAYLFCAGIYTLLSLLVLSEGSGEPLLSSMFVTDQGKLSFFLWVFALGFLVGGLSSHIFNYGGPHIWWRTLTLGGLLFQSPHKKAQYVPRRWYKNFWLWQLVIFLLVTFGIGVSVTQFSLTELLDQDGFAGVLRLFYWLSHPNWELLPKAVFNVIVTFFMAFMATALAIPLAFILSFFCAKNIMKHPLAFSVYIFLRLLMNITRSIEAMIWAIIFSVWVGIGPFAGMLALMIHSVVSLAKQYSEIIETVSDGPIEGIISTGANKLQVIWFAVVPQVILPFISFTVYRWDINIRMATIIGIVGGGGIGTLLIQYQGQAMWPEVGTIILVIAFVVWFMDTSSAYLREALK